eukprot:COSAG01_NODE_1737_length_9362_cov_165.799309_7_plen_36_part_00
MFVKLVNPMGEPARERCMPAAGQLVDGISTESHLR